MPAIAPVTTPEDPTTVAFALLLVQTPPDGVEFNVVVAPTHTFVVPVMAVGLGLIVIVTVAGVEPQPLIYDDTE